MCLRAFFFEWKCIQQQTFFQTTVSLSCSNLFWLKYVQKSDSPNKIQSKSWKFCQFYFHSLKHIWFQKHTNFQVKHFKITRKYYECICEYSQCVVNPFRYIFVFREECNTLNNFFLFRQSVHVQFFLFRKSNILQKFKYFKSWLKQRKNYSEHKSQQHWIHRQSKYMNVFCPPILKCRYDFLYIQNTKSFGYRLSVKFTSTFCRIFLVVLMWWQT